MKQADVPAIVATLAPVLRDLVLAALAPLAGRLDALEAAKATDGEAMAALHRELADIGPRLEALAAREPVAGPPGRAGEKGDKGEAGKDGGGISHAVIDRDGFLSLLCDNGRVLDVGTVVGKDGEPGKAGADGLGFDDLEVVDEPMAVVFRFRRGEQVKEFRVGKPTLADLHKGVWKQGEKYSRGDGVTWGGSSWMALRETEARPGTALDWLLIVKRGNDGKPGDP